MRFPPIADMRVARSDGLETPNHRVRSPTLCPVELGAVFRPCLECGLPIENAGKEIFDAADIFVRRPAAKDG